MGKEKFEAFVLRAVKYSEHDKMLTLFTKQNGKISAVAKGAQSSKSKYIASSQLFCLSEFILSTSIKMPYVASAEVIKGFYGLNKDIERLTAASYCAELINALYEEEVEDQIIFNLLYHTLNLLEKSDVAYANIIVITFILKFMGVSGMYPILDRCAMCENKARSYHFDFDAGGIICPECKTDSNVIMPKVTAKEADFLNALLYIDITKLTTILLPDIKTQKYLLKTINDYLIYAYGKKIKSFDLLYSL